MLVIWRAQGQSVRIGSGLLTVEALRPAIRLTFKEQDLVQRFVLKRGGPKEATVMLGSCRIVLLETSASEARLGFDAPADIRIIRSELLAEP
jgi:sRNA-binding carbon storage regulator CsrA